MLAVVIRAMQPRVLNSDFVARGSAALRLPMEVNPLAFRVENVGGHMTELLELQTARPRLQIVFVPGNPGIVSFYQDYLGALSTYLDGSASITAVSHIAHTAEDYENGKEFSLKQQIEHKAAFLQERILNTGVPTVLIGHSIGAYISIELLKRFPDKLQCAVGLYPFLKTNSESLKQSVIRTAAENSFLSSTLSSLAGLVGHSPAWLSRNLVKTVFGRAWGPCAVDVTCKYLLRTSMVRNFTYMGKTEFEKLAEEPDWDFLRKHHSQIKLLFGGNDHWGPLALLEQIREQVPELESTMETENITHDFCCSKFGSEWVARYTANSIKDAFSSSQ